MRLSPPESQTCSETDMSSEKHPTGKTVRNAGNAAEEEISGRIIVQAMKKEWPQMAAYICLF